MMEYTIRKQGPSSYTVFDENGEVKAECFSMESACDAERRLRIQDQRKQTPKPRVRKNGKKVKTAE